MKKLSLDGRLAIVRLYLGGLPYDEIAAQARVSKGTVANVVADFKTGRVLDAQEPVEQLDLLRGLAADLRRLKLTPAQAVIGTAIVSHLQELEIEPGDIQRFAAVCRRWAGETKAEVFVRAALYLYQLEEHTGLSTGGLAEKAHGLQAEG